MPVPMIAPIPSSVRSIAVSVRLSALPPCSDVADQLLDRLGLQQIRIHSPSRELASTTNRQSAPGIGVKTASVYLERVCAGRRSTKGADARLGSPPTRSRRSRRPRTRRPRRPSAARSSVMPPIATTGLPSAAPAYLHQIEPTRRRSQCPWSPCERRARRRHSSRRPRAPRRSARRSCVERPTIALRTDDARAPRRRQVGLARRGRRRRRASRAMSARSLTMTFAPGACAAATIRSASVEQARARVVLAAKLQQPRAAAQTGLRQRHRVDRPDRGRRRVDDRVDDRVQQFRVRIQGFRSSGRSGSARTLNLLNPDPERSDRFGEPSAFWLLLGDVALHERGAQAAGDEVRVGQNLAGAAESTS